MSNKSRNALAVACILATAGCGGPSPSAPAPPTPVPVYSPATFCADIESLIADERYDDAVAYVQSADATQQVRYDGGGFLAVGEDMVVLPGVDPSVFFDRDRDYFLRGTQDAIQDWAWQQAATEFAREYNRLRLAANSPDDAL